MGRLKFRVWMALSALTSLALRAVMPPAPIYGAGHDDELMVRLARQIRAGNWLGDYSILGHRTLAKPAGYPLYLAYSHILPWAPTITAHLMILGGSLLLMREMRRLDVPRPIVLATFVLICFFPPFLGMQMSRIYRESLLVGTSFLAIGLAARLGHLLTDRRPISARGRRALTDLCASAFSLGVVLSLNIATKPGWYPLGVLCGALAVRSYVPTTWAVVRSQLRTLGLVVAALAVGLSTVIGYIVIKNNSHYGVARLDSFASGPYADAINLWVSVESDDSRPYILVDASQRRRVYAISPTAALLKPHLEAPPSAGWRGTSCASVLAICNESTAWFPWELRDAAELAGLGDTAEEFDATFRQIAKDIEAACDQGKLKCGMKGLAPGALSLSQIPPRALVDAMATGISTLLTPQLGSVTRGPYTAATDQQISLWSSTVRGLPPVDYTAKYRPETPFLGNVFLLSEQLFALIWTPLVLVALLGLALAHPGVRRLDPLRLVGFAAVASVLLGLGQIAIMEASSGGYMTVGRWIYTLPSNPPIFVFLVCGYARVAVWGRSRLASARQRESLPVA